MARGERIDHYETVRVAKSGRRVEVSLSVSALRDRFGKVIGASKVVRDISERKQAERLQHILVDELNHRVKNTLATVQAIAGQSLLRSASPNHFVSAFSGRIQATGARPILCSPRKRCGARISARSCEIRSCWAPQAMIASRAPDPRSCSIRRRRCNWRWFFMSSAPTRANMALCPFPMGLLSLCWGLRANEGDNLLLDWRESNGPKVSVPTSRGFGMTLDRGDVAARWVVRRSSTISRTD